MRTKQIQLYIFSFSLENLNEIEKKNSEFKHCNFIIYCIGKMYQYKFIYFPNDQLESMHEAEKINDYFFLVHVSCVLHK